MGKVKPTQDMIVGRHARKAAQIMEERGWTRGMRETSTGEVCLMGAFGRAVHPMAGHRISELEQAFSEQFNKFMWDNFPDTKRINKYTRPDWAAGWNDAVLESKEETLAWLNKFADAMDPQR